MGLYGTFRAKARLLIKNLFLGSFSNLTKFQTFVFILFKYHWEASCLITLTICVSFYFNALFEGILFKIYVCLDDIKK